MYLLDLDDERDPAFKSSWDALGDSIVVVGGKGLWNCHIHTDDIGASIETAIGLGGRPSKIRVTDLHRTGRRTGLGARGGRRRRASSRRSSG